MWVKYLTSAIRASFSFCFISSAKKLSNPALLKLSSVCVTLEFSPLAEVGGSNLEASCCRQSVNEELLDGALDQANIWDVVYQLASSHCATFPPADGPNCGRFSPRG